ncbi:hypothetical protein HY441_00170 [Candidatus Microgenomates bacterium]|nr:hypothetical protein [Candidatus Microgenomates bacterium]
MGEVRNLFPDRGENHQPLVIVELPPETLEQIEAVATRVGLSPQEVLEDLVRYGFVSIEELKAGNEILVRQPNGHTYRNQIAGRTFEVLEEQTDQAAPPDQSVDEEPF